MSFDDSNIRVLEFLKPSHWDTVQLTLILVEKVQQLRIPITCTFFLNVSTPTH